MGRILLATIGALCCLGATAATASAQSEYDTGYELGSEAYEYGIPLLDTQRIFRTSTSVSKSDGRGNAPVNRLSHARKLAQPEDRTVVAPNHDTLYSLAWLDLSRSPQVLHVPRMHRFFDFELVSPWTENFRNIGTPTGASGGGDFAIVGPDFDGRLPEGVTRIRSPYDRVWLIGRTLIEDEADTERVNRIQNSYRLLPLSHYGRRYKPPAIEPVDTTADQATIPGLGAGDDPLAFYGALGRQMKRFEPPAADAPLLERLATIGVGTGLDPAADPSLSAETLRGMRDAVSDGPDNIQAMIASRYVAEFDRHNGYLLADIGHYGTDYELRAMTDRVGVGALKPKIAIYAFTQTAHDLSPLTGSGRYVLHIPADRAADPGEGVLVADPLRLGGLPVREPVRSLPAERSLRPALQRRRLAGPLRAGRAAGRRRPGAELDPVPARRVPADLAPVRDPRGALRDPRRHRLAAARRDALRGERRGRGDRRSACALLRRVRRAPAL